jgi:hypothetical protein
VLPAGELEVDRLQRLHQVIFPSAP